MLFSVPYFSTFAADKNKLIKNKRLYAHKKLCTLEPSITEGVFTSKMIELPDTDLWSLHSNSVLARQRIADNPSLAKSEFAVVSQLPSDLGQ